MLYAFPRHPKMLAKKNRVSDILLAHGVDETKWAGIGLEIASRRYTPTLQILRLLLRPSWRPQLELVGTHWLDSAQRNNKGVVIWVPRFSSYELLPKIALCESGYRAHQLSQPQHGFGSSGFTTTHFNSTWAEIENRFLESRITMEEDRTRAVRKISALLRDNQIVLITDVANSSSSRRRPFLQGTIAFPLGAPRLAVAHGATLLTMCITHKSTQHYKIEISAPVYNPEIHEANIDKILDRYSQTLGTTILKHPLDWIDWGAAKYEPPQLLASHRQPLAADNVSEYP
ncbi:MAG: hypothetical protein AAF420_08650 [Pseudomonadota bacterium]